MSSNNNQDIQQLCAASEDADPGTGASSLSVVSLAGLLGPDEIATRSRRTLSEQHGIHRLVDLASRMRYSGEALRRPAPVPSALGPAETGKKLSAPPASSPAASKVMKNFANFTPRSTAHGLQQAAVVTPVRNAGQIANAAQSGRKEKSSQKSSPADLTPGEEKTGWSYASGSWKRIVREARGENCAILIWINKDWNLPKNWAHDLMSSHGIPVKSILAAKHFITIVLEDPDATEQFVAKYNGKTFWLSPHDTSYAKLDVERAVVDSIGRIISGAGGSRETHPVYYA